MVSTDDNLITQLRAALWAWKRSDDEGNNVLQGLALVDQYLSKGKSSSEASLLVIADAIEALKRESSEHAEFLEKRFVKGIAMAAMSRKESQSERSLYLKQKEAIRHLARVLMLQEHQIQNERKKLLTNLPPMNLVGLVGIQEKLDALIPLFTQEKTPTLIVLSGIGGIGKTSLAHDLVKRLVLTSVYDHFAWVGAGLATFNLGGRIIYLNDRPAPTLEQLVHSLATQLLKHTPSTPLPHYELQAKVLHHLLAKPQLVVIDNLETVPDIGHLLPFLRQISATSKVLLTSRVQLLDEGDVYPYIVPPLSLAQANDLFIQEANVRNFPVLLELSRRSLESIYDVVGGNPLALRLVAGQIHFHGLEIVLQDLRGTGGVGEQLYTYLFEWTWKKLSHMGKAVFLAMPLLSSGGTLQDLVDLTEFPVMEVRQALHELVERNLVNVQGDSLHRIYSIHNLTRVFLEAQVAQWT